MEGLADNIRRMLNDDLLWAQFSLAAQKRARELFSLREQTAKLEYIYDRLLMRQPAAAFGDSLSIHLQG